MPCCPNLLQSWDWITLSLTLMCLEKRLCKRFCSCKHAQGGRQQILQLKLGLWINEYSKRIFLDIIPNFVITYNIVYLLGHIITLVLRHYIRGYFKLSIRWQGLFFHFIYNPLHGLKFRANFKLTQKLTLFFESVYSTISCLWLVCLKFYFGLILKQS